MFINTFTLLFASLFAWRVRGQRVRQLTPKLLEELTAQQTPKFFVKLEVDDCGTNDVCQFLDQQLWRPLAAHYPQLVWTKLNCSRYRELCLELSVEHRLSTIQNRFVDLMTVAYSEGAPNDRLVELYRGDVQMERVVLYFRNMIERDDPFEPDLPSEIDDQLQRRNVHPKRVSLTILVLAVNGFTRPDIWSQFLKDHHDLGRVMIHDTLTTEAPPNYPAEGVISVPTIFTNRHTVALVRPILQLLRYALAYGGSAHYAVVSGDSVPLRSLSDMITELSTRPQTRFEKHLQDSYKSFNELRSPYRYELQKSKNWIVLNHDAATFFASPRHDETHNFEMLSMADEYYWINVAQEYGVDFVTDVPSMYDEWPLDRQAARPNMLKVLDDDIVRHGYLFARKITNETEIDLSWLKKTQEEGHRHYMEATFGEL